MFRVRHHARRTGYPRKGSGTFGPPNVTARQAAEAQAITDIVCVQNNHNLAHREDDALIDDLARQGVPFFPLGGFTTQ